MIQQNDLPFYVIKMKRETHTHTKSAKVAMEHGKSESNNVSFYNGLIVKKDIGQ